VSNQLATLLVALQTGCATMPPNVTRDTPQAGPGLSAIAALGRTGVAAVGGAPEPRMAPSGWTAGAARGAAAGAIAPAIGGLVVGAAGLGADSGSPGPGIIWFLGWTAVGLALAPVGAAVGAVVGAVQAPPPEQIRRAEAALIAAASAADLPTSIRDETIRLGSERSWHTLVPMSGEGSEAADQEVGTVLEIVVRRVALEKLDSVWLVGFVPPLELWLDVDTQLVKASDGTVLHARSFHEQGGVEKFSVWTAADARAFREGLVLAAERVADRIAEEFFPGPEPPAATRDEQPVHEPAAELPPSSPCGPPCGLAPRPAVPPEPQQGEPPA
jgi:hypothetical protein